MHQKQQRLLLFSGILPLVIPIGFLYRRTLDFWFRAWGTDDFYCGHGWLVVAISSAIVWHRRRCLYDFPGPAFGHYALGGLLVLSALLMQLAASWLHMDLLSGLSLILLIAGILWTVWGRYTFRALAFPLGLLVFAVPMPVLGYYLGVSLQEKSALVTAWFGSILGLGLERVGASLHLRNGAVLFVEEACSGLHSILSLFVVVALLVWWLRPSRRASVLLVCATFPIAILANALRLLSAVLVTQYLHVDPLHPLLHGVTDAAMLVLQVVALWLLARRLSRANESLAGSERRRSMTDRREQPTFEASAAAPRSYGIGQLLIRSFVLLAALVSTILWTERLVPQAAIADEADLTIPMAVGEWMGSALPGADRAASFYRGQVVMNTYRNPQAEEIELFIVGRDGFSSGCPSVTTCLPRQGWHSLSRRQIHIAAGDGMERRSVQQLWLRKGDQTLVMLFWYQLGARRYVDPYAFRLAELKHRLLGKQVRQEFVRLTVFGGGLCQARLSRATTQGLQFWDRLEQARESDLP